MFKSCTPLLVVWSYYCRSLLVEINASKFSLDRFVKDRVPSTLQRKIWKWKNHGSFWICSWGKLGQGKTAVIATSSFSKCFPCTLKRKAALSNFSSVAGSLRAEELSWNIDHHCRNRLKKELLCQRQFSNFQFAKFWILITNWWHNRQELLSYSTYMYSLCLERNQYFVFIFNSWIAIVTSCSGWSDYYHHQQWGCFKLVSLKPLW